MNALIFVGFLIILRYMFEIYKLIKFRKYINPFSAIAHIALGLLLISISLNSSLSTERAMSLKIDETEKYKDLTINFQNINLSNGSNYDAIKADLLIQTTNGKSFKLSPEKRRYFTRGQITTETAIHASPIRDIYITIGDQLDDGSWVVNIQLNYLIRWIWFSAILMSFAGILLIITNKKSTFTFKSQYHEITSKAFNFECTNILFIDVLYLINLKINLILVQIMILIIFLNLN